MKKISYVGLLLIALFSTNVFAHGYLNGRFYPCAITVDEPFISDKILLDVYRTESPAANGGDTWTTNPKLQYAKTITKDLQAAITASYLHIQTPGQKNQNGFDNWSAAARYNIMKRDQIESMLSVELIASIGGTGSHLVNAAPNTTLQPEILFAQGFSNLPDGIKYLRPFAVLFAASPEIITNNYTVTSVNVGAVVQYSLPYLQEVIANFNSPWMDHVVPTIELPFNICTQNPCSGHTTGNIDPGVLIYNKYGQIGLEAIIPVNSYTGSKVGGVAQIYLYLDNLMPNSLGKPLF